MGIRVAQVYTQFKSPSQPYLYATSERLRADGVDLRIYTRVPASGAGDGEVVLLRGPEGVRGLPRAVCASVAGCGDLARRLREWRGLGLRSAFRRWLDLRDLIRQEHDVIHVMNWPLFRLLRPYLQASGIPFVISFRGYDIYGAPREVGDWANLHKHAFREAGALHFVSEFLQQEGIRMGAPEENCVVIYPSVGGNWFGLPTRELRKAGFRVLTTGRLVWEKGYELALLTVRELLTRGVPIEYHVVGDGPDALGLMCWADALGVGNRVVWHGTLPTEEVRAELIQSNVYFQPSVVEAFGVAMLEAQAVGLPVVATRVGGIDEAVLDGESGFLLEFGDVQGMADALERLWREPELAVQMGETGRRYVENRFSVEREAAEWIRLYQRLADKKGLGLGTGKSL